MKLFYVFLQNSTLKCDDRNNESSKALHTLDVVNLVSKRDVKKRTPHGVSVLFCL